MGLSGLSVELTLQWIWAASLEAELADDREQLGRLVDATVSEWPPEGGEWDVDAMSYFRELLDDASFLPDWAAAYVILDGRLVGTGGFFGPPNCDGEVEIGFSVCRFQRRQGVARALVARLCLIAADRGCTSVRARTTMQNTGALATLRSNSFTPANPGLLVDGISILFRRSLQ